jgi:hypothetical protein
MPKPRQMRLSQRHVDLAHRDIPDPGAKLLPGFRSATDDDYAEAVDGMLKTRPAGDFWLFGYGSLIWNPETAFEEKRLAMAKGWRRNFCLGPDYRYRGSHDSPGLMMALDRGGQCKGMVYRLPEKGLEAELHRLIRRELSQIPSRFPLAMDRHEHRRGSHHCADLRNGPTQQALCGRAQRRTNRRGVGHGLWLSRIDGRIPAFHRHDPRESWHSRPQALASARPGGRLHRKATCGAQLRNRDFPRENPQ